MRRASWARKIFWATAGLFLLSWAIPLLVRVNYWQEEITAALSRAFDRPVRIGDIRLRLLGELGLEIENVVLEEDPRLGIEPFARMETLQTTVALRSLWRNQVEFSSLVLVRPSLNVVRSAAGQWNLESLGKSWGASPGAGSGGPSLRGESVPSVSPQIRVESGRINFKSENQKKAYMIEALDLELLPPSSAHQTWKFRFEATPNRTDFPLHPASRLQGQGEFGPFPSSIQEEMGTPVWLDWSAENALLADLLILFSGKDFGAHGAVNLQGRLAGTTSLLRLSGKAEVRDLHRWDLLPPPDASVLRAEIAGIVDLAADSLQLTSLSIPLGSGSVVVQGRIEELLRHPRSAVQVELRRVSLGAIAEIARQFTTPFDSRFAAQGTLDGRVQTDGFSGNLFGGLKVSDGSFQESESSQMARFSGFQVVLEGKKGRLGPLEASLGPGGPLRLSLQWDAAKHSAVARLRGEEIPLPFFLHWARALGTDWGLADMDHGNLAVRLDVSTRSGEPPKMAGWAQISEAVLHAPGMNPPLRVAAARLQFQRGQVMVRPFSAALGPVEFRGSLVAKLPGPQSPAAAPKSRVHSIAFEVEAAGIDVAEWEGLLNPPRRPFAFLWFGRSEHPAASFLNSLEARGTLRADWVRYRGFGLEKVKASLDFRNRRLEITEFAGEWAGGTHQGAATIHFDSDAPSFTLQARYSDVDLSRLAVDLQALTQASDSWKGFFSGKLSGELRLASAGRGWNDLLEQLTGSGEATGRDLAIHGLDLTGTSEESSASATHIASISSTFQISDEQVHITEMEVIPALSARVGGGNPSESALWRITGSVGFDRRLDLVVQQDPDGTEFHWAGTLAEPQVSEAFPSARGERRNASILPK